MLSLPVAFVAILEQASIGESDLLVALVELTIPVVPPSKGTETIYYALSEHDVVFDSQTYTAWNGSYARVDNRSDGEQPEFGLQLSTVEQTWSKKISDLHYYRLNLNASTVAIRVVALSLLADTDAQIAYENMAISGYSVDAERIELNISTPFNALSLRVPLRLLGGKRDAENEVPGGPQLWYGFPYGLAKVSK